jgi:chaperonin cofactor prefoldin
MAVESHETISGWVLAGIAAVITSLSSAVVFLFKSSRSIIESDLEKKVSSQQTAVTELRTQCEALHVEAKECRKDREDLRVTVAELSTRLEFVESRNS